MLFCFCLPTKFHFHSLRDCVPAQCTKQSIQNLTKLLHFTPFQGLTLLLKVYTYYSLVSVNELTVHKAWLTLRAIEIKEALQSRRAWTNRFFLLSFIWTDDDKYGCDFLGEAKIPLASLRHQQARLFTVNLGKHYPVGNSFSSKAVFDPSKVYPPASRRANSANYLNFRLIRSRMRTSFGVMTFGLEVKFSSRCATPPEDALWSLESSDAWILLLWTATDSRIRSSNCKTLTLIRITREKRFCYTNKIIC